ncbi:orotidine-5'-phosphate decarboxylase [Parafrigoribacterium mesophilum]|uniref:orotidine-5'-phosphate decarboxylase n=1 Tax=Parafrigoribacterium mesophilum TaxID=433646 RepID=UPI0031FD5CF8
MTSAPGFGERLAATFAAWGQLCVGIDPHPWLLTQWAVPDTASGVREFGLRVVDACAGRVGIVKPQVAFFERHGAAGFAALEAVLGAARAAGLLVIADAKRGDVGSSAEAYGAAWLTPGSPLEAAALTVNPYLGVGSLDPVIALARRHGKGLYVLAATSNPEGLAGQTAVVANGEQTTQTLAGGIVNEVMQRNATVASPIGDLGVVLGATLDLAGYGIDPDRLVGSPATSVLAPGFGHQGARFDQVRSHFRSASPVTVLSVSRSILAAGPGALTAAIDEHVSEAARCLA